MGVVERVDAGVPSVRARLRVDGGEVGGVGSAGAGKGTGGEEGHARHDAEEKEDLELAAEAREAAGAGVTVMTGTASAMGPDGRVAGTRRWGVRWGVRAVVPPGDAIRAPDARERVLAHRKGRGRRRQRADARRFEREERRRSLLKEGHPRVPRRFAIPGS